MTQCNCGQVAAVVKDGIGLCPPCLGKKVDNLQKLLEGISFEVTNKGVRYLILRQGNSGIRFPLGKLEDDPGARSVIQKINDKLIELAPNVFRQKVEY